MNTKETLINQLDRIKSISTSEEWLVFVLAYYENLSILEISKVIEKNDQYVNMVLDKVLKKAIPILGENVKLLK